MGKQRPTPSLPKLKCLGNKVDADDAAAGELIAATHAETRRGDRSRSLAQPAKAARGGRGCAAAAPSSRKARAHRRAAHTTPPAAELLAVALVVAEAPAPTWPQEPPVEASRIRTTSSQRRKIPKSARLVPVTLDDPDYTGAVAQVVTSPAGSTMNGASPFKEWQAPPRPQVHVVAATRGDVLNYMFARGQIPRASYLAGRRFQGLYEEAELAGIPTVDITMPRITVRSIGGDYVRVDVRRHAAERLHQVEGELLAEFGLAGLRLIRDVLGRGETIEACAGARGDATDKQQIRFWGSLFRRCLRHLAVVLGFATSSDDPRPPLRRAARACAHLLTPTTPPG